MKKSKLKLLLFDIDNTLVFGEQATKYYKQYSVLLEKTLSICLRIPLKEAREKADEHRRLFNGRGEKAFETYSADYSVWHSMICTTLDPSIHIRPLPKVQQLLLKLKNSNYILGAITDGPTLQARKILKAAEIDKGLFSIFIGWEAKGKMPKGGLRDVYEKVISDFKLNPSEILMVGDSIDSDIIPAYACGLNVLYISDKVNKKFPTVKSIEMLPDYLKKYETNK